MGAVLVDQFSKIDVYRFVYNIRQLLSIIRNTIPRSNWLPRGS